MSKLTPEIMGYINTIQALSLRRIEAKILNKFQIEISRETIRKYKNSLNDPKVVIDKPRIVKKVVRTPRDFTQKNGFDFSVNGLKQLLEKNPNHYWHNYLKSQVFGRKGRGGKLRSDIQKLFDFIRDVT